MITIISGTNRDKNETLIFAKHYQKVLQGKTDEEVKVLSMESLPKSIWTTLMYAHNQTESPLFDIQDKYIIPASKFIILTPEYNGSFPGILKLFIDGLSVREYPKNFTKKKISLVGIASGRAGNLRGMDHLAEILSYLGAYVHPNKLPISMIRTLMDEKKRIVDQETLKTIDAHVSEFLEY